MLSAHSHFLQLVHGNQEEHEYGWVGGGQPRLLLHPQLGQEPDSQLQNQ